jgi:nucleolar protein 9
VPFKFNLRHYSEKQLCESRSGSHLFEAILRAAPRKLMDEIFRRFFRDKLRGISSHPTANFVLQALMGATREPDHGGAVQVECSRPIA